MPSILWRLLVAAALASSFVMPSAAATAPSPAPQNLGGPLLWQHGIKHGAPAATPPPKVAAASYLLADARSGAVLASKEPHRRLPPASTLKTLTALALLPELDPKQVYTATYEDAAVEGARVGMVEKGRYTVHQLFEGLFVMSGNDAANGLANAAGGLAATVRRMSETAAKLQAHDTIAVNPTGLDEPGQLSSAYDLALFGRAGLQRADFRRYAGTVRSRFPGAGRKRSFQIWTRNKFLVRYNGAIGIKNGYTSKAHHTLVAAAKRGDRTLIVTIMGARQQPWMAAAALMDWGFAVGVSAQPVGQLVGPAPVVGTATSVPGQPVSRQDGAASGGSSSGPSPQLYVAAGVVGALALAGVGAAVRTARSRRRRPGAAEPETY